jgi:hypothetical protein
LDAANVLLAVPLLLAHSPLDVSLALATSAFDVHMSTLYSCTCLVDTYISLDANGETLVVKSVHTERSI